MKFNISNLSNLSNLFEEISESNKINIMIDSLKEYSSSATGTTKALCEETIKLLEELKHCDTKYQQCDTKMKDILSEAIKIKKHIIKIQEAIDSNLSNVMDTTLNKERLVRMDITIN